MRVLLAGVSSLLAWPALPAQTTWTVTTPGGVTAAIQAAAPGDIILLPNTGGMPDYDPFPVNKGVTIRGAVGCNIGWSSATSHEIVVNAPAGQRAHLDGLDLTYSFDSTLQANVGTQLVVNGGAVTVQRCNMLRRTSHAAVLTGASVLFQSCSIAADGFHFGGQGIEAQGAHVTVRDCVVRGSNRTWWLFGSHVFGSPPAPAVGIVDGSLHAERTSFTGGSDTASPAGAGFGVCGINLTGTAATWLSDSTVTGGNGSNVTAPAGTALCNGSATTAYLANVTLVPGAPNGSAFSGAVNAAEPLVRLALAPPFQRGVTSTMTCLGAANNLFVLGLALDPAPAFHPFVFEPLWCVTNVPITFGLLDATGVGTLLVAVPATPSLQNLTVWCQAISGLALPLHASTLAGGMIL